MTDRRPSCFNPLMLSCQNTTTIHPPAHEWAHHIYNSPARPHSPENQQHHTFQFSHPSQFVQSCRVCSFAVSVSPLSCPVATVVVVLAEDSSVNRYTYIIIMELRLLSPKQEHQIQSFTYRLGIGTREALDNSKIHNLLPTSDRTTDRLAEIPPNTHPCMDGYGM